VHRRRVETMTFRFHRGECLLSVADVRAPFSLCAQYYTHTHTHTHVLYVMYEYAYGIYLFIYLFWQSTTDDGRFEYIYNVSFERYRTATTTWRVVYGYAPSTTRAVTDHVNDHRVVTTESRENLCRTRFSVTLDYYYYYSYDTVHPTAVKHQT